MNSEFDPTELHRLFTELSNNTITTERHERLESTLRRYPQARQQWFLFSDVEIGLKDWAVTENERRVNQLPSDRSSIPSYPLHQIGFASIAVTLLIAIAFAFWINRTSTPRVGDELLQAEMRVSHVAVLTHAVDAVWNDQSSLSAGSPLKPSMVRLRSGALLIEFFSGATVVLEGPAELEIVSTNKGHLLSGKLNAHVPPQAQGFTVTTAIGEIVDHSTDFGVDVAGDKPHELHVFTGNVEVNSGETSLDVQSGEAIRFGTGQTEVFDADPAAFLIEEELIEQSRLADARRLAKWRDSSGALSEDPANLYHLRHDAPVDPASSSTRGLVNSARGSEPNSGGTVVGSERVTGRWNGKSGILFRGPGDRIRMTVSQPMKMVSLLAWVNVQSLPRWQNSLLSADSEKPGAIRWQLTKRGQLRLAIARNLGRQQSDWEAVESEPFLTEDQQRRWLLVATTFDGTTIRHYSDGRLVGTGASFTPESLQIGTAEIGNWLGDTRRELHAILDEFVILNRVLSEEEIVEIYRYGKP